MSKEIDINNEEQILKECDFDYYYNSVCSRELCMFFNDIARQDSHFDKRQAYIDLGRIGIMINKLFRENIDLEAKLAELNKEPLNCSQIENGMSLCVIQKSEIAQLKQQLAEKDKEIKTLNKFLSDKANEIEKITCDYKRQLSASNILTQAMKIRQHNQDKISFCIEKLEKVKKFINEKYQCCLELEKQGNLTEHGKGSKLTNEIVLLKIDNQIEELKKEMK